MAARALSHGYDLVGPTHSVVYHLWKRDYRKTYWSHDVIAARNASVQKIKEIMIGKLPAAKFGMGSVRSWAEIQQYLGIDFDNHKFIRPHHPWRLPSPFQQISDRFAI
jgi:hypothetical protein